MSHDIKLPTDKLALGIAPAPTSNGSTFSWSNAILLIHVATKEYLEENNLMTKDFGKVFSYLPLNTILTIPHHDHGQSMRRLYEAFHCLTNLTPAMSLTNFELREIISLYGTQTFSCDDLSNLYVQIDNLEIFNEYPYDDYSEWIAGIAEDNDIYQLDSGRYVNLATLPDLSYSAEKLEHIIGAMKEQVPIRLSAQPQVILEGIEATSYKQRMNQSKQSLFDAVEAAHEAACAYNEAYGDDYQVDPEQVR